MPYKDKRTTKDRLAKDPNYLLKAKERSYTKCANPNCTNRCLKSSKSRLCYDCYKRSTRRVSVRAHDGYRLILVPESLSPRITSRNKHGESYVYEHVLIAEKALGRFLQKGECVHHINGDTSDNRNCNLLICYKGYHRFLHERAAKAYGRLCVPIKKEEI